MRCFCSFMYSESKNQLTEQLSDEKHNPTTHYQHVSAIVWHCLRYRTFDFVA